MEAPIRPRQHDKRYAQAIALKTRHREISYTTQIEKDLPYVASHTIRVGLFLYDTLQSAISHPIIVKKAVQKTGNYLDLCLLIIFFVDRNEFINSEYQEV